MEQASCSLAGGGSTSLLTNVPGSSSAPASSVAPTSRSKSLPAQKNTLSNYFGAYSVWPSPFLRCERSNCPLAMPRLDSPPHVHGTESVSETCAETCNETKAAIGKPFNAPSMCRPPLATLAPPSLSLPTTSGRDFPVGEAKGAAPNNLEAFASSLNTFRAKSAGGCAHNVPRLTASCPGDREA